MLPITEIASTILTLADGASFGKESTLKKAARQVKEAATSTEKQIWVHTEYVDEKVENSTQIVWGAILRGIGSLEGDEHVASTKAVATGLYAAASAAASVSPAAGLSAAVSTMHAAETPSTMAATMDREIGDAGAKEAMKGNKQEQCAAASLTDRNYGWYVALCVGETGKQHMFYAATIAPGGGAYDFWNGLMGDIEKARKFAKEGSLKARITAPTKSRA